MRRHSAIRVGGKTGSGDNRVEAFARRGQLVSSRVASRTAGFVFYVGDRWFGVITASVPGPQAAHYTFTSALPLAILKLLGPALSDAIRRQDEGQNERRESLTSASARSCLSVADVAGAFRSVPREAPTCSHRA